MYVLVAGCVVILVLVLLSRLLSMLLKGVPNDDWGLAVPLTTVAYVFGLLVWVPYSVTFFPPDKQLQMAIWGGATGIFLNLFLFFMLYFSYRTVKRSK